MRISLDLDDGVKVNYGKFGDLLAEVKAVTVSGMSDFAPRRFTEQHALDPDEVPNPRFAPLSTNNWMYVLARFARERG